MGIPHPILKGELLPTLGYDKTMPRGPGFAEHALERPLAMNTLLWSLPVAAAVGPLAKDVESLALCLRALLSEDMFSLDSTVPPLPFNEEVRNFQGAGDLWEELQGENP